LEKAEPLMPRSLSEEDDAMKFWIVVCPLWLIALSALWVTLMLPGDLDVYFTDTYVVVRKLHLMLATLLLLVLPLVLLTIWRLRSSKFI
jgi:hypothetical protein